MALFQPIFVVPDVRSGIGLGTIDAAHDMTVSWKIQGASPLVAFSITIYTNNAASTQLYTTGKITNGCPAYGTASNGAPQIFSYTIPAANLITAGITNGNEYKLIITQWWDATHSIAQSSASVFNTRSTPTLSINPITERANVTACSVALTPIQDLHGYSSPWVGGAGKNLYENTYPTNGTLTNRGITFTRNSDGSVTLSGANDGTGNSETALSVFHTTSGVTYKLTGGISDSIYIRDRTASINQYAEEVSITGDGDPHQMSIIVARGTAISGTVTVRPMFRLASVADATWEPYANICPISGTASVNIYRSGADTSDYNTFTVSLGQTVYGGTIDVISGTGEITQWGHTFDGTETFTRQGSSGSFFYRYTAPYALKASSDYPAGSSHFANAVVSTDSSAIGYYAYTISGADEPVMQFRHPDYVSSNAANFTTWIGRENSVFDRPVTAYATLETPISFSFTGTSIATLLGDNNVWSDGGNITLTLTGDDDSETYSGSIVSFHVDASVARRSHTFTGNYSQAQGDTLNYFRWQIAYANDLEHPFFDSGNISGTMDISCTYDGFFTNTDYAIKLTVQTESGIEVDTGWGTFSCQYAVQSTQGQISAGCVGGTDAVLVEWSGIGYVPGEAEGDYSISEDNILTLPLDSSITWDTMGTTPMNFPAPWTVVWKGKLGFQNGHIFTLGQSGGNLTLQYPIAGHSIRLAKAGSQTVVQQTGIINAPTVTAVLTADTLYLRVEYMSGGLYPSSSRYPSDTLYPIDDTVFTVETYTLSHSFAQSAITFAEIGGYQECDFFEIINGEVDQDFIAQVITNGTYDPALSTNDYMNAHWTQGINASTVDIGSDTLNGFSLYRRRGTETNLVKIADTTVDIGKVYDYGARTGQGPYSYYLFPIGNTAFITDALTSNPVMPCWWNWTLMECEETADEKIFNVLAAYKFRLNIETAAMSNNNTPTVLPNFTRYPKVQLAPQNYKSGALTGLIGAVYWKNGQPRYKDTIELVDAIYALSTTHNALFLKNRKGDLIRIRISGTISMQTGDATRQQTQTMTLPWVEVGSATGVSLYSLEFAGVQEEERECTTQTYEGACEE